MVIKFFKFVLMYSIGLAIFCSNALAGDPPPLVLAQTVSTQVLSSLQQHKSQLNNRQVVYNIINTIAIPHFDLNGIARTVVGPNYWDQAGGAAQQQFVQAFKRYVVDMYSSALAAYSNETIQFRPLRDYSASSTRVLVYSTIIRTSAPSVALNYRLANYGSVWKIYDFSVEGISMVQSYRAQFADTLRRGGLPELTRKLQSRGR